LSRTRAALLVVDVQDRLVPAMPREVAERVVRNTRILVEAAGRLKLPIVMSEQYPKGLGSTVTDVKSAVVLAATTTDCHKLEKTEFSAASAPGFPRSPTATSGSCAAWRRTFACTRRCATS
jgi:hypothetical protein